MNDKINKLKKRKGEALVVAILLAAIIGSAALGVTAIAFRQVNIAETYNNGLVAYYAAESGLEQGLLYNKYDKNAEIPTTIDSAATTKVGSNGLFRRPTNFYRNFLDLNSMRKTTIDSGISGSYSLSDRVQVYDLQSYYKQAFTGDDVNGDGKIDGNDLAKTTNSLYQIAKDNSIAFTVNSDLPATNTGTINLYWRWLTTTATCNDSPSSPLQKSRALEVKLKDSDGDEQTTLLQDLRCSKIANAENATIAPGGNIGVFVDTISISKNTTEMTLKPVGGMNDGIYFGFTQKTPGGTNQRLTSGLATTIQSTGYFAGNSRQISANVDRQTGTVLDIFNYVIYKGQ